MDASTPERPLSQLETRPEARPFAIEDLLKEIRSGKIRIPTFQRPLRWKDEDRLRLFDSMYRGFPIGTLLFWRRSAQAQSIQIGRLSAQVPERNDALWVVDGQQRLVTLADTLLAEPLDRAMRFDLLEPRFSYGTEAQLPPPRWLPLSELADTSRLLHWAARHLGGERTSFLDLAFDTGKRLREYQVPAYVVESDDESVIRQIFDRTNSTGKALSGADVFDALHAARSAGRPASLRDVTDGLRALGFGALEPDDVLLSLLAVRGKDPAKGFRQIGEGEAAEALAETEQALRLVFRFLQEDAGFPHRLLLPYQQPLVALALYFHRHPEPGRRSRSLLGRWLWRGSLLGSFRGETPRLRRMLRAASQESSELAAQNLIRGIESRPPESLSLPLAPFNMGSARTKMQLTALAALHPRHLETGEELDLAGLCEQAGGPTVRLSGSDHGPAGKGLAARLLYPAQHRRSLLEQLERCADHAILRSHGISPAAQKALRGKEMVAFLAEREEFLAGHLASYFAARAVWNPPDYDRPSLEALVVEDEA